MNNIKVKGKFIAIEGIDGTGKSTLVASLKEKLEDKGIEIETTREPSEGVLGTLTRTHNFSKEAEALLYMADRAEHTSRIRDMLEAGTTVITDRYEASTLAYQSAILGDAWVPWLQAVGGRVGIAPDITILLDIDPALSMRRVVSRGEPSRYETAEYLRRVRHNYLRLGFERGYYIVDATKPAEDVLTEVMSILDREQGGDWWAIRRVKRIMRKRFANVKRV